MARVRRVKRFWGLGFALLGTLLTVTAMVWLLLPEAGKDPAVVPIERVRKTTPTQGRGYGPQENARATSATSPMDSPSPTAGVVLRPDEEEDLLDPKVAIAMTRELIEDYRRRAEFPPDSRPIEGAQDPILAEREVSPIEAAGPEGEEPVLTVMPDRLVFEAPETPVVYAYLILGDERIAVREMFGTILNEEMQEMATVAFRDDGREGDAEAADRIYTATFPVPAEEVSGSYLVRVVAVSLDGAERRAGTSFQYSRPGARPTGQFRERIEDGSLLIEVQLAVERPGIFHLSGSLYDSSGRPIGIAQNRVELDPGESWVALRYYGRMFHPDERTGRPSSNGPYQLRFLSLLNATRMPNALSRLWEVGYWTSRYEHTQLTSEPFNDPFYLEAIAREETELKRLEALQGGAEAE